MTAPIIADGCILFSSWRQAVCLDSQTKKVIWTQASQRVEQSPDGTVWKVDTATGHLLRFTDIRSGQSERVCRFTAGLGAPPLLEEKFVKEFDGTNLLMQAVSGEAMAVEVNLRSRQLKWHLACDRIVASTRDLAILLTNSWGGTEAGTTGEPQILAVRRKDGTLAWSHRRPSGAWTCEVLVHGDFLFISSYYRVTCLRLGDGAVVADYETLRDGNWIGMLGGKLYCSLNLSPKTGLKPGFFEMCGPQWRLEPTDPFPHAMSNWLPAGHDLILSSTGQQCDAVQKSTGKIRWTIAGRWNPSRVTGDVVYLAGARTVLEVKISDGTSRNIYQEE